MHFYMRTESEKVVVPAGHSRENGETGRLVYITRTGMRVHVGHFRANESQPSLIT
jgi:hypothetical protein